ncbi:Methyl-accepting chemotaxis protein [uncultured Coleofasciculus sp.]|uniref:Methyl-accepting chemotaxis protein n=1 Tax=uncultured Coleofasciculus sp. TaxID=1267456 RepID=A0A6J4KGW5_9CYAN|nr:Methyl-accepting chemotaxis protein [uncultured Coleofasciculus sp.]
MKGHRSSLERLRSSVFSIGATITIATLALLSVPTFTEQALSHSKHSRGRWIEVDISRQQLIAWNNGRIERVFWVSSGKRSTPTPYGTYSIQSKYRVTRMRGANYNVPDVPYAMYYSGNYALHGAYWHNNFGSRVSHGCVNLGVRQARWLYNWAPVGTTVVVHR